MAANFGAQIASAARTAGVPAGLLSTLVKWESGGNPGIVSPVGAIGLTQLMPGTARGLGVNPWDPAQNLLGGAKYLREQYDRFGSWELALAAYNAGPNAVAKYKGIPPYPETQRYVHGILSASKVSVGAGGGSGSMSGSGVGGALPTPAAGLDLGQVGLENLATNASPLQSLENLGAFVHANGGPGAAVLPSAPPARSSALGPAGGFLLPGASFTVGRKDQGQDFRTDPGAPIVAPGAGVVVAVKSDPNGFGPAYPIVRFTSGPYAGQEIYLGHTLAAVRPGQRFQAGQVLSRTGTRPVGNASVPGWAEIGFAHGGVPGAFGQGTPFKS